VALRRAPFGRNTDIRRLFPNYREADYFKRTKI
jgi:hypothetical protein